MSEKIKNHFQIWRLAYLLTMLVLVIGGILVGLNYARATTTAVATNLTSSGQIVNPGSVISLLKVVLTADAGEELFSFTITTTPSNGFVSSDFVEFGNGSAPFFVLLDDGDGVLDLDLDTVVTGAEITGVGPWVSEMPFDPGTSASGTFFIVASITSTATLGHSFTVALGATAIMATGTPPTAIPITATSTYAITISDGSVPPVTPAITNVVLSDVDTIGYGLDGRDFRVTWTPSSTWNPSANGFQMTNVFITTSGLQLTTSTLFSTGCNGSPCQPWGGFNQFSMATHTLPQFMKEDSTHTSLATSSSYVAWVYVQSAVPFIVSSSPVSFAAAFDDADDTSAPQIMHNGAHAMTSSTAGTLYANIFDDQTSANEFNNGGDSGAEYFRLYYTSSTWPGSPVFVDATIVIGAGELFSFTIPTSSVPTAGNSVKYYLEARDRATPTPNVRYFCVNPNAVSASDCQNSPFTVNTVVAGSRSVSGKVTSDGQNLADAIVFAGGYASLAVLTDVNGDYTITGLPNNDVFDFTATKLGYAMVNRRENIGTSNKTGVNLQVNRGGMGFFEGEGGGDMGGAPHVVFSGPPEGMQGFPLNDNLRAGFNQPLDASTVNTVNSATSSNVYLVKTMTGVNVPGTVTYCSNYSQTGCSSLPPMDNNVILFDPTSDLVTSTQYTLVITGAVKSQSGQAVQGNRPEGGHKINFSTMNNQFNDFGSTFTGGQYGLGNYGMSGQFMPPYVRSMTPAPGMTVAPNAGILLEFNEAMSVSTINNTNITLYTSGGVQVTDKNVSASLDSNESRFVTISHDALNTGEYEVRVKGAVANASGLLLRGDNSGNNIAFSSRFTVSGSNDSTAPTIYPLLASGSTGAKTNSIFEFGFNEQLAFSTINSTNILMYRGATAETVTVDYDPGKNSVYVASASALSPNTVYTITFNSAVTDLAGNGVATTTYTYTTGNMDTTAPKLAEARCDDYRCYVKFNEPMNRDSFSDSKWVSSTINTANLVLNSGGVVDLSSKSINYDPIDKSIKIEGLSLTAGVDYTIETNGVTDISDNVISTSSFSFSGKVESSKETYGDYGSIGMFGPPTENMMGEGMIGQGEFKPMGFGNFTADQFAMGQADMAYPFNPMASKDVNVFQVRFTPGVVVQTGDQVVLTFPNGTNVNSATFDTQSPYYIDFNQFMAGTVTGTAIAKDPTTSKVTITLGVSGTPVANDPITIDLKKILNPAVPKGPQTGGYTVGIKLLRSGAVLANKTSMPYFIMAGGTNTLVVDVVAGTNTSTPTAGADGTVYLHGGGPGGPMDRVLTMLNGDIDVVDGDDSLSAITYSNLPDGCYGVGTEPYITLGGDDYYGQMSPEPVCLNGGETKNKWMLLSPASAGNTATVTIKWTGVNLGGKDIDIFAGGPNKFVVKTITGATTSPADGYQIKLNANGSWFVGMGPAMSKSTSGGVASSMGVMPPPPMNLQVSNIDSTPTLSVSGGTPPGVTYSNGVITYAFATADKTVAGTVRDGSGNDLANVEVSLHRQGFGAPIFTQTNASGTFSMSVTDYGNYEIGARKDGMPTVFKNIEVRNVSNVAKIYVDGQDKTNIFVLNMKKSSYTISGKVLDSSSNGIGYAPVMGVDTNGNNVFGQTTIDGSYTLFVDSGNWSVRAELPPAKSDSCGTYVKAVTIVTSSQSSQNITPTAGSCYTLSGTITVSTTLSNVPVFIEEWDNTNNRPLSGGAKKPASTDSSGFYSVKVLAGNYRVGTWHPDFGELSVTTTVSGTTTKDIAYSAGEMSNVTFSFTGGTSAMNGFVELKNSADQNKRFGKQINGLDSSVVMSVPTGATYNYFVDVFGVGKFTGSATPGVPVTVNLGVGAGFVTVTGTIYDGSDVAKAGALLTFNNASTTASVVTDENGEYSVSLKAGTYTISESLAGYVSPQSASVAFTANTSSYDFGGASPDQSALQIANWVVTGTVFASDGTTPMTDGYVWGTNASSTMVSSPVNTTDGTYSLPVTNGVWTIKAVGPKHLETTLSPAVTVSGANQTGKNITLTVAGAGVNVPTSTTGIVTASAGGSLNDSGASGIKLTAGAGVLETGSGDVTLNFEKSYTAPDTENYQSLGNASFSIGATGDSTIKNLNGNAEIQLDYSTLLASLPAGVSESDLQLSYYSPERDEYVPVEGGFTVDPTNHTITGLVSHFTDFVITYYNSSAGITVTEVGGSTAVTEGGATDSITYVLTSQPTANVVITPSASGSKVSLSPATLTFTSVNWATPQTLTVTAVDDTSVEGSHSDTITHVVASVDGNYSGVSISNITATITDNDSASSGSSSGSSADTTPPTNTSIVIASGVTSTASTAVNLTLSAIGASQMMISNDSIFTAGVWETYTTVKPWTLSTGVGTKTIYAKFKDITGNVSTAVSDTILLSTTATTTPVVITEPVVIPVPVTTPVLTPILETPAVLVVLPVNLESKVTLLISGTKYSYQPGDKLQFKYDYKNETNKRVTIKIVRQLLNSKGKVIKSVSASKYVKAGLSFQGVVDELVGKYYTPGEYTERIRITVGKVTEENSFKINVEQLKKKYFVLASEMSAPTSIAFDEATWKKIKTNIALPANFKFKYSYTNSTDKVQTVKMVRELVSSDGKAVEKKSGKWNMSVGEKDSLTATQPVAGNLSAGNYTVKITAYDWKTNEVLAQNQFGFVVELR